MKTYFMFPPLHILSPMEGLINRYKEKKFSLCIHFTGVGAFITSSSLNYCWLAAGVKYEQLMEINWMNEGVNPKDIPAYRANDINTRKKEWIKLVKDYLKNIGKNNNYTSIDAIVLSWCCTDDRIKNVVQAERTDIGIFVEIDRGKATKGSDYDIQLLIVPDKEFQKNQYFIQTHPGSTIENLK